MAERHGGTAVPHCFLGSGGRRPEQLQGQCLLADAMISATTGFSPCVLSSKAWSHQCGQSLSHLGLGKLRQHREKEGSLNCIDTARHFSSFVTQKLLKG